MTDQIQTNKDEPEEQTSDEKKRSGFLNFILSLFDFLKTVIIIIVLAFIIRVYLIQPFIVEGESMEPTFQNNDYLITEKVSFRIHAPQRGEVIIFHPPDNPSLNYIKRLIGLPGDRIQIKDGQVFVNGEKIDESYLATDSNTFAGKESYSVTLNQDEYFVLGDNRDHSRDSREIGAIPRTNIVSRVWFRLLPIGQIRAFAAVNYNNSL